MNAKPCISCGTRIMRDAHGCAWCGRFPEVDPLDSLYEPPRSRVEPRPGVVRWGDVRAAFSLASPPGMFVAGATSHDHLVRGHVGLAWAWFGVALLAWACWAARVLR